MTNFKDKWSTSAKQSLVQRIGDSVKPKGALKPRVETATNRVHAQVSKLDTMLSKLKTRDNQLGQAMVEYTIVVVVGILLITTGPMRDVVGQLAEAINNN